MFTTRDLIGKEFKYKSRGPDAFDCWGLARECYLRWHGVDLPDQESTSSASKNGEAVNAALGEWQKLPDIEPGSVLLLRIKNFGAHVGFATSRTRFIHALENYGVIQSPVSLYKRQIMGAYHYVGN